MRTFAFGLIAALVASAAVAQTYPSPTYQNLGVRGNLTVNGALNAPGVTFNATGSPVTATNGNTAITLGTRAGQVFSLLDWGGVPDATVTSTTVTMTSGSKTLAVSTPMFSPGSVGQNIVVPTAGVTATTGAPTTLPVLTKGSGYTSVPSCAINDSSSSGNSATCAVALGLVGVTLDTGGSACSADGQYIFIPTSNASGNPATGSSARILGTVASGTVTALQFAEGGAALDNIFAGGTGYVNGTYTNVPVTGGTGTGALATVTVSGGAVTNLVFTTLGTGYVVGDKLSVATSSIGGGSGSGFTTIMAAITGGGFATALPDTLTGATLSGAGCTPTAELSYGVQSVAPTSWGNSLYNPLTTTVTLTGGSPSVAATVSASITVTSLPLITTIASYSDSQHVVLTAAASHTVPSLTENVLTCTDNTTALAATIAQSYAYGGNPYIPRGNYCVFGSVNPGPGPLTIRGDGMEASVIWQFNTTNSFLQNLTGGSPTSLQSTLQLEDFQIRGLFDFGQVATATTAPAIQLNNYSGVFEERMKFYNIPRFAQSNESIYKVRVVDSVFDTIGRDQARFRSSFNVFIHNNHFIHSSDDSVALHQANYIMTPGTIAESMTVTDNYFEDTTGIHILGGARQVTVTGNHCRRVKLQCVNLNRDTAGEGVNVLYDINVSNNDALDTLSRPPNTAPATIFSVQLQVPTAQTGEPNYIPGFNYNGNNLMGRPWEYDNVNCALPATSPCPAEHSVLISHNVAARALPDTAAYSSWGQGQVLTTIGWVNPPIWGSMDNQATGITYPQNGHGIVIDGNTIQNTRRCMGTAADANFAFTSYIQINGNNCFDNWEYGFSLFNSGKGGTLTFIGNHFINDPYHISGSRTAHGGWVNGSSSRGITVGSTANVIGCMNTFAEVYQSLATDFNGGCVNFEDGAPATSLTGNINSWNASNAGIGVYHLPGRLWTQNLVNADPTAVTPPNYYAMTSTHTIEGTALPSSGNYTAGDRFTAIGTTPGLNGVSDYVALTTGAVTGSTVWGLVPVVLPPMTVSTLTGTYTCNTARKGMMGTVTDGNSPTYLGTVAGGGAVVAPVVCNGSNWIFS